MEGLWIAHFESGPAHGNGIAVLRAGEILGGDFSHTWTGTYQEEGASLYARIRVAPYRMGGEPEPDIRERSVELTLTGSCTPDQAMLSGHPDEGGGPVTIEMRRAN